MFIFNRRFNRYTGQVIYSKYDTSLIISNIFMSKYNEEKSLQNKSCIYRLVLISCKNTQEASPQSKHQTLLYTRNYPCVLSLLLCTPNIYTILIYITRLDFLLCTLKYHLKNVMEYTLVVQFFQYSLYWGATLIQF